MIVMDSDVPSETLRPKPDAAVRRWLKAQLTADVHTTTIGEAEIFYGVALRPAGKRRGEPERLAMGHFDEDFAGRVLVFDGAEALDRQAARPQVGTPSSRCLMMNALWASVNFESFIFSTSPGQGS